MASVASQLIEESLYVRKVTVSRMRERYAQTVLTFRITYVYTVFAVDILTLHKFWLSCMVTDCAYLYL